MTDLYLSILAGVIALILGSIITILFWIVYYMRKGVNIRTIIRELRKGVNIRTIIRELLHD